MTGEALAREDRTNFGCEIRSIDALWQKTGGNQQ